MRPIIGIIPDYKEGSANGYSSKEYYALRANYVRAVTAAGAVPLLLAYDYEAIDCYLEMVDGLMVVGGGFDISPLRYNETKIHPKVKLNLVREEFEHKIASMALESRRFCLMPVLAICNGMQLINILHGGSLIQHIPDEGCFTDHEQSNGSDFSGYHNPYHEVNIVKGSKLSSLFGQSKVFTNSSHHQAVSSVGKGLLVSALAHDGIIEAIEKIDHPFCIGVQWHPEFDSSSFDRKIFEGFVEAANIYKAQKK